MDTPTVPYDVWVCGECKASNYIENSPAVCPVCSHERDYGIGCCSNPGETTWSTGLFSTEHEHQHLPCDEALYGVQSQQFALSSSPHFGTATAPDMHTHSLDTSYNGYEAKNRDYFTQRPLHQHSKEATLHHAMSSSITTLGGAGSQGEGVWICESCQQPNAAFHWPVCGACFYNHE